MTTMSKTKKVKSTYSVYDIEVQNARGAWVNPNEFFTGIYSNTDAGAIKQFKKRVDEMVDNRARTRGWSKHAWGKKIAKKRTQVPMRLVKRKTDRVSMITTTSLSEVKRTW